MEISSSPSALEAFQPSIAKAEELKELCKPISEGGLVEMGDTRSLDRIEFDMEVAQRLCDESKFDEDRLLLSS